MKILIAEDDIASRRLLEAILKKWGYDVIVVSNGNDAIDRMLGDDPPRIALVDWVMPSRDGLEVCHLIRQIKTTTPPYLILLTGRSDKEDITKGLDAGADDYVIKPYNKDELKARINVGLRMIELQNEMAEKEKFQGVLEMAGAVCHEINQPLMVISGYSELLQLDMSENDSQFNS